MFGVNWSDPTTLWLNLTNLGLGLVVAGALVSLGVAIVMDVIANHRASVQQGAGELAAGLDPHMLHTPELGLTMADGGDPLDRAKKPGEKAAQR